MSSTSRKPRNKRIITSASRRKSKKRKIVKRGTSPSHFLMSPEEELQFCPTYQTGIPGRHQMDQLQRASSALYLKPREVPTSNTTSIYVSTDYDNGEYSTQDLLKSPIRQHVLDNWCPLEIAVFEAAICAFGKDFQTISRHIKTKTRAQCVEFYYDVWKHSFHYYIWKSHADTCYQQYQQEQAVFQHECALAQKVQLPAYFDAENTTEEDLSSVCNPAQQARIKGFPISNNTLLLHAQTQQGRAILEAAGGGWSRDSSASLDCVNVESLGAIDALQRDFLLNRNYDALTSIGLSMNTAKASRDVTMPPLSWSELQSRTLAGPGSTKAIARKLSLYTPVSEMQPSTLNQDVEEEEDQISTSIIAPVDNNSSTSTTTGGTESTSDMTHPNTAIEGNDCGLWARLRGQATHSGLEFRSLIRHRNSAFDNALLVDVNKRNVYVNVKPGTKGGKKSFTGKLGFNIHMPANDADLIENVILRKEAHLYPIPTTDAQHSKEYNVEHSKLLFELNSINEPNFAENSLDIFSTCCPVLQLSTEEQNQPHLKHLAKDNELTLKCETCEHTFTKISDLYTHTITVHYNESSIPNIQSKTIKE